MTTADGNDGDWVLSPLLEKQKKQIRYDFAKRHILKVEKWIYRLSMMKENLIIEYVGLSLMTIKFWP